MEFIETLFCLGYGHEMKGESLRVTHDGHVLVYDCFALHDDDGIVFENDGDVSLPELECLPTYIRFLNSGNVHLPKVKMVGANVEFHNKGDVNLNRVEFITEGDQFNNRGKIILPGMAISGKRIWFTS